ncbi:hypothetical protein [Parafrankia sp. EUN1f]|uniref:hypothetical protein n=1 Tax=Parafrankia sp. EUN1f TaxID=102897 RepID=UPI0018DC830F|nr:hypothetical protein [Parafrankia sp. EUN1f]
MHAASRTHARFDDPDLVGCAGLVPVVRLAEQAGLSELVEEYLRPAAPTGANAPVKVGCLVAGMVAGADSIEDMELLRDGAVGELFDTPGFSPPTGIPPRAARCSLPDLTVGASQPSLEEQDLVARRFSHAEWTGMLTGGVVQDASTLAAWALLCANPPDGFRFLDNYRFTAPTI